MSDARARRIDLLTAPLDQDVRHVGGRPGAAAGPRHVLEALEGRDLVPDGARVVPVEVENRAATLEGDLARLTGAVEESLGAGRFPVVLGGSHGTTYASVLGVVRARGPVDVAYLDVHFDLRPFEPVHTSGSSFRRLIEEGVVPADHVHPLGIQRPTSPEGLARSGYEELAAWADDHEVPWSSFDEVRRTGVGTAIEAALTSHGPRGYLSFDVDGLDQRWTPGVSAPGRGRFTLEEGLEAVRVGAPHALAFDVVEYAPRLDEGERTLGTVVRVLETLFEAL